MPLLRRSNSQRTRDHRRAPSKYSLGLQILCFSIVCLSALLTLYQLSSAWLSADESSQIMRDLTIAKWSTNHVKETKPEVDVLSTSSTLGQRLGRFFKASWISSAKVEKPHQTDRNCTPDDASVIPRGFSRCWDAPKRCATVEEMGAVATGDTRAASVRVRAMIEAWVREHGAEAVRGLPAAEFCARRFVMGLAAEDGLGNNLYKLLSAAGLALILNRSLIIGERGSNTPSYIGDPNQLVLPFGDYLVYSNQSFTMHEVKRLWSLHSCTRPMTMRVDDIEHGPGKSKSLCDDWTRNTDTILWFKGAMDPVGLQFLLKNRHVAMRSAAARVLGSPAVPSSRANVFGELLRAFVAPSEDIVAAVEWALGGGPAPDVAVHLRMRHNRSLDAPSAASECLASILQKVPRRTKHEKHRVVIISDTPEVFTAITAPPTIELIQFNYKHYLATFKNLTPVMSLHHGQPPRSKARDWGEMPRWVSIVDFFLASRAKTAVISAASERICTTYAQLVGALAAADNPSCSLYSSFQSELLSRGLVKQSGWGHAWRTFGGRLGCRGQGRQCAVTPLMAYAWWDAPWQSPARRDVSIMRGMGVEVDLAGAISEVSLDRFCEGHEKIKPTVYNAKLPVLYELQIGTLTSEVSMDRFCEEHERI